MVDVCVYRKMPEREDDHLTPATRLLEKRREMAEVEQALAAQKEVSWGKEFILLSGTSSSKGGQLGKKFIPLSRTSRN